MLDVTPFGTKSGNRTPELTLLDTVKPDTLDTDTDSRSVFASLRMSRLEVGVIEREDVLRSEDVDGGSSDYLLSRSDRDITILSTMQHDHKETKLIHTFVNIIV